MPQRFADANIEAMRQRESLVPYIYTQLRQSYDTGLSIIVPMYYDYPDLSQAYKVMPLQM